MKGRLSTQSLKTNEEFITELTDENEFYDYVDFIDNYKTTFDFSKRAICFADFIKVHGRNKDVKAVNLKNIEDFDEINKQENQPDDDNQQDQISNINQQNQSNNQNQALLQCGAPRLSAPDRSPSAGIPARQTAAPMQVREPAA